MLVEAKTGRIVPILAVGVYIAYSAHKYGKKRICSAILIICIVFSFMPKQWFDIRSEQVVTSPIGINSLGVRPIMYQLGFEMVMDKPLTGYGFGNLAYEFKQRKLAYERLHDIDLINLQITEHIHNEPLQWMMQLGVVPGIAFLLIFIVWCVGLFKGWLDPGILLLALPFVGHSLLEYPFYHSAPHLFAFVIILGLAIRKTDKTIRFSPVLSGIFVPLAGFVAYKIIAFMMMSLAASSALVEYRLGGESDISLLYSVEPTSTFAPFFIHEKHEWIFKQALQTGKISQKETFDFIDFLEAYRKEAPQAVLYVQLAELYIIAGQKQKAQAIMSQAKSFFPNDEKVIAYFEGR